MSNCWYPLIEETLDQIGIMTPMLLMSIGLVIGLEHAFESDHVAAVCTQISKNKATKTSKKQLIKENITKSSLLGALWGAGHTTSLVLIGFLVYFLTVNIQNRVFFGLEFLVGIMLLVLGITTILNKKILKFGHKHPHLHKDGTIHFDNHAHNDKEHSHQHRSYVIGLIHGLAGSGSLIILASTTLDDAVMAMEFILIFGIGSILGMVLVSGLLGLPLILANKTNWIKQIFRYVAGGFSLVIGINIVYNIMLGYPLILI